MNIQYYYPFRKIITLINDSTETINICSPSVSSKDLSDALIAAKKRRVKVRIITSAIDGADTALLSCASSGIPTYGYDGPNSLMHNKFIIIDKNILIRASSNFSIVSLTGNYENIQILRSENHIKWYMNYFEDLWKMRNHVTSITK